MFVKGGHLRLKQLKKYLFKTPALAELDDTLDWPLESVGMAAFLFLFSCFTAFQKSFAFAESRLEKNATALEVLQPYFFEFCI